MNFSVRKEEFSFTAEEMFPHWAYKKYGIAGDSIIAFVGPCRITPEHLIDLEEFRAGTVISAEKMLHFIVEHFDTDLEKAILRQYLLVTILEEKINNRLNAKKVIRWSDDLYDEDYKLTVSAVTKNVISSKIHLGINVVPSKIKVKTRGLSHYDIDPYELAEVIISQYRLENRRLKEKCWKMKPLM